MKTLIKPTVYTRNCAMAVIKIKILLHHSTFYEQKGISECVMQFFSQSPRLVWIHLALHSHEMEHLQRLLEYLSHREKIFLLWYSRHQFIFNLKQFG